MDFSFLLNKSDWTTKNDRKPKHFDSINSLLSVSMSKVFVSFGRQQNTCFTIPCFFSFELDELFLSPKLFTISHWVLCTFCSSRTFGRNILKVRTLGWKKKLPDRIKYCFKPFRFITLNIERLNVSAGRWGKKRLEQTYGENMYFSEFTKHLQSPRVKVKFFLWIAPPLTA